MNAIKNIIERASKLNGTVVLPEGQDARLWHIPLWIPCHTDREP